jgi:hypothetical protein
VPAKSKAQVRWLFAAEKRGEVKPGTAKEWVSATPGGVKSLPERVGSSASANTRRSTDQSARRRAALAMLRSKATKH